MRGRCGGVPLHAEAAVGGLPQRAEAAVQLRAEAGCGAAAPVKSPRHAEAAVAELPRWLEACSRGALKVGRRTAGAIRRRGTGAGGRSAMLLHTGKRMIARQSRSVAGACFRTSGAGSRGAR